VNSLDAALVLQVSAALLEGAPCGPASDANRDGSVDALDAALILQFDAGLLPALPAGLAGLVRMSVPWPVGG